MLTMDRLMAECQYLTEKINSLLPKKIEKVLDPPSLYPYTRGSGTFVINSSGRFATSGITTWTMPVSPLTTQVTDEMIIKGWRV